ncbi:copper radical oxidase [Cytidiella melzeri]|nr:copper radical oxidase [Cytidiella melzeri]
MRVCAPSVVVCDSELCEPSPELIIVACDVFSLSVVLCAFRLLTIDMSRQLGFRSALHLLLYIEVLVAAESAWNGHTTPGSTEPNSFNPYYVAPGTKGYDSGSRLLHYAGKWQEKYSSRYAHKSVHTTSSANSYMSFTFTGTGVEWFGSTGKKHGIADVYIDGQLVKNVDTWSAETRRQQRLYWVFDLPHAKHTLKIVNSGTKRDESGGSTVDIDALVVTMGSSAAASVPSPPEQQNNAIAGENYPVADQDFAISPAGSQWTLSQKGTTGVHAMQLAVISETHAIIIDKVEHNPLSINGHPAWAALYNLKTHSLKPLSMRSNSFCAGGTFLSNGTLINVGGNPVVEDHTSAADFGDVDGLQAIRIFEPCDSENVDDCEMVENHARLRMASPRWYNTVLRISDGSAMIIGGSRKGGWINNATTNNPTIEYFPPKDINGENGLPIKLQFFVDTLNSNLFPIAFSLPDGKVFMAANHDAMIYDWKNNVERRLPQIPNGVRVTYPMTGTGVLLPLTPANNYMPEILLCGGSTVDDTKPGYEISSQDSASSQCSRMVLTDEGIAAGWQVEQMPQARTMPDAVLLPTGKVLIVNGAGSGISGYGNVLNQVGASNADNPVFTPVLYDPAGPAGQRFSSAGMPTSDIPRLYHSVATMTPSGTVMITGSNPNLDRSEVKYGTEYRVEWLSPPYMAALRPEVSGVPKKIGFGKEVNFSVKLPSSLPNAHVKVVLMDFGYVTHAVHANSRLVYLESTVAEGTVTATGPPDGNVYPPGPGWIMVVVDDVPSEAVKVMIGDGQGPEVNEGAIANLLSQTSADQYDDQKHEDEDGSE